jgi:hypothetical protein
MISFLYGFAISQFAVLSGRLLSTLGFSTPFCILGGVLVMAAGVLVMLNERAKHDDRP